MEKSVEKGVAAIDKLGGWLNTFGVSQWQNPLPAIRDEFLGAVAAIKELRKAHSEALESVTAQEKTLKGLKEHNDTRETQLNKRQEDLDAVRHEQDIKTRELQWREEELEKRLQKHEDAQNGLAEDVRSHSKKVGVLEAAETALEAKRTAFEKERADFDEGQDEQVMGPDIRQIKKRQNETQERLERREKSLEEREKRLDRRDETLTQDQATDGRLRRTEVGKIADAVERAEAKLASQSSAFDRDAQKLGKQSSDLDNLSNKLSELKLDTHESRLQSVQQKAGEVQLNLNKVGAQLRNTVDEATKAANTVGSMNIKQLVELESHLESMIAKTQRPSGEPGTGQVTVAEEQADPPSRPASSNASTETRR